MIKEILNGDSLYILKNYIPSGLIDMIITSPPYNVAHKYENYNDDLDFNEYLNSMKCIFIECYRVLKVGGRICINIPFAVKNKESKQVRFLSVYMTQILNEIGFVEFELICWHKGKDIKHFQGNNTAWGSWKSPSCPSFRPLGESVLVFYKGQRVHKGNSKNIDISAEEFKEWTKNVWYFDKNKEQGFENVIFASNNAKKNSHPAPYPEELVERLLKLYSYADDIVLDPFNGIGTTTLASYKLDRQFIGIELSKQYCNIALERLKCIAPFENIYIKSFDKNVEKLVNNDKVKNSLNEIFYYKEAFSPFLIDFLQKKFQCNIESVFDPFCGVGSSFINENIKNIFGFDTNPFAINVAKAKLEKLDLKAINKAEKLIDEFDLESITNYPLPQWQPFNKYADSQRFSIIMSFIESFKKLDLKIYNFMKYLILSNLDKMLDYKKDGNGIKFRKSKVENLNAYLKELAYKGLQLKKTFDLNNDKTFILKNQSSVFNKANIYVDCILTSPPYANLFDYFEVYKMELWSSGIVKDYAEWRGLKKSALRNNKNTNLNPKDFIDNEMLLDTLQKLESANLENSQITMIKNYFYDMKIILKNCFEILKNKSFCFIVIGNSCYKGIPILSDEILATEAEKIGFKVSEILIARKLNTSSQQMRILDDKAKFYLRESVVVLQKE